MKYYHFSPFEKPLPICLLMAIHLATLGCGDTDQSDFVYAADASQTSDMLSPLEDATVRTVDMSRPDTGVIDLDMESECPDPPLPPEIEGCFRWECNRISTPDCWTCAAISVEDGDPCTASDGSLQTCGAAVCSATTADPSESGPHQVSSTEVNVSLGQWPSNEMVKLDIFTPNGLLNRPVVIFHHGFTLSAQDYESYGEHFASWGYVVVMPNVTTSIFDGPTHTDLKGMLMALIDWIATHQNDQTHPLAQKVNQDQLVLAGHSLGGKISFLTATEDSRVRAIMGVDPVDSQGGPFPLPEADYPSVTPELMNLIEVPSIVVGETTNAACEGSFCQACAPADNNFHQYYLHTVAAAVEVEVVGANHMSFLDNINCGSACSLCPIGTDDPLTTRRLTHGYLTAFLNVIVLDAQSYRPYLTGEAIPLGLPNELVIISNKNDF